MTAPPSAIISVALEYNANPGDNIVWLGKIEATREDSYTYTPVERHLWSIDKEARDLVFKQSVVDALGYRLMKITGGDNPAQLTFDSDVTEIPERYMVHFVVGSMLGRYIKGETPEQARVRQAKSDRELGIAEAAKGAFPMLVNARMAT